MPSVPSLELLTRPTVSSFHGALFSHRLKHLEKSDRRGDGFVTPTAQYSFNNMYSCTDTSDSKDVNSSHKLCEDTPYCTSRVEGSTLNEIETGLTKFLNIQDDDDQKQTSSFISSSDSVDDVEIQYICEEEHQHFDKCWNKSAISPTTAEIKLHGETDGCLIAELITENAADAESVKPYYSSSKSFPEAPSKLVSAMKGNREKNGGVPLKKLNVTWAPDVYDPIPTAVSHVSTSKNHRQHHHHQHHRSKKHTKTKQKGSSSKGSRGSSSSSGKDKKKQSHRAAYGGGASSTSTCLKLLEEEERRAVCGDFYEISGEVDFDAGSSPDPYCGSSFLKKTVSELRFSITEAT